MNRIDIKQQLQNVIEKQLLPLIDRDYYLLELPYYPNIGDTLIWQGELDFLRKVPFRCKGMHAIDTYHNPKIEEGSLILFQGGGNFGDIYNNHHDFKMDVMKNNPTCKFIFFPQTVWFENIENLHKCARFMSNYKAVICARDSSSYEILENNFSNEILLLPDMAFCIEMDYWTCKKKEGSTLLLERQDQELKKSKSIELLKNEIKDLHVNDWPTMQHEITFMTKVMQKIKSMKWTSGKVTDWFVYHIYRPYLIRTGIHFLNKYDTVYSTRLHAGILSILLDKECIFLDNSYGKNSSFYNTWLSNCNGINLMSDYESFSVDSHTCL